jgi:palmitoyltransferase
LQLKYPYNLGLVENVRQVLGDNIIFWLCPQNMNGDGIRFKTKQGLRSEGIINEIYYHHMSEELKAYADWDDDDGFLV